MFRRLLTNTTSSMACASTRLSVAPAVSLKPSVRFMATYKTSTGLTGLAVDPDGLNTVFAKSQQVLKAVQKIPESSQYRIDVEKWFSYIATTVSSTTDVKEAEKAIGLGQIEEVSAMADQELSLVEYYYANKIWEMVEEAQLTADALAADMAEAIEFSMPHQEPVPAGATSPK